MSNKCRLIERAELSESGVPLIAMYSDHSAENEPDIHKHDSFFEICYSKRGTQKYDVGADTFFVNENEVLVIFPRENHSVSCDTQSKCCFYALHLDSKALSLLGLNEAYSEKLTEYLYSFKTRKFTLPEDVCYALIKAYDLSYRAEGLDIIAAKAYLTAFLVGLINTEHELRSKDALSSPIRRAKKYIDENITEQLNLVAISEMINLSLSHFKYKFKKEIGLPPWEYIIQQKIYDSTKLIPQKTLTYIAYEYGFSSPQHYSKKFKDVMGMTPREYKLQIKN